MRHKRDADLTAKAMHTATPANPCCGYVGVLLGPVSWHQITREGTAHVLISQEIQCPQCGKKGRAQATAVADIEWPDEIGGATTAEKAFAEFEAEQILKGAKE